MSGPEDARRAADVERRLATVRGILAELDAPGALLTTRRNFAWATAGGANHVVQASELGAVPLLVTRREAVALAPVNEAARIADEELAGLPIGVVSLPWERPGGPAAEAERRVGGVPLDDAALEPALLAARSVLSALDGERMAWVGGRLTAALADVLAAVAPGASEQSVAAALVGRLAADGLRAPVLLAAADERIARYRHPLATGRRIERRLMLVAVAERWGLHVAATRIAELEPPDAELAGRIEATTEILRAMRDATRPGATLGDVVAAAQRGYATAGHHDEWLLHHQGGTIGYGARERIATPGDAAEIRVGMAFAWNPSITGAKAEETFILTADGPRMLG